MKYSAQAVKDALCQLEINISAFFRQRESVRATLDDKQHIEEQRERYQAYQTVVDEIPIENDPSRDRDNAFGTYDYDDEYDDTYDVNQIGANDLDEEDELLNRRYELWLMYINLHLSLMWVFKDHFWDEKCIANSGFILVQYTYSTIQIKPKSQYGLSAFLQNISLIF